jgi:hypothetical protein
MLPVSIDASIVSCVPEHMELPFRGNLPADAGKLLLLKSVAHEAHIVVTIVGAAIARPSHTKGANGGRDRSMMALY